MRKVYLGMVVLALAALPAAASAQQNMPPRRAMREGMGMGMMMGNPADMLLRRQAELKLTPDQMEKLGKIRDRFQKENAEDLARARKEMDEMRARYGAPPYSAEVREKMQKERAEARQKYAKLFENARKAREESMEVLTPEQRTQLREMRGPGMMEHSGDRGVGGARRGRRSRVVGLFGWVAGQRLLSVPAASGAQARRTPAESHSSSPSACRSSVYGFSGRACHQ